jgi:hypothetical protein
LFVAELLRQLVAFAAELFQLLSLWFGVFAPSAHHVVKAVEAPVYLELQAFNVIREGVHINGDLAYL